jgi:uncharacterized protein DUF4231
MNNRDERRSLERTYETLIDGLDVGERNRQFMRLRWLDQLLWTERAAKRAHRWYHSLRLTTVIGAVVVPALVGLNVKEGFQPAVAGAAFAISLIVAISAGVEELFHFGDRWRHYRLLAEQLKIEGWSFFQLTGPYRRFNSNHAAAYAAFARRVEALAQRDIEVFITDVAREEVEDRKN